VSDPQVERRKFIPSVQYNAVCKEEFKKLKKGQKKHAKGIKALKDIVMNGHTTSIDKLLSQNKWIMRMLVSMFFVLLVGMLGVILRMGVTP